MVLPISFPGSSWCRRCVSITPRERFHDRFGDAGNSVPFVLTCIGILRMDLTAQISRSVALCRMCMRVQAGMSWSRRNLDKSVKAAPCSTTAQEPRARYLHRNSRSSAPPLHYYRLFSSVTTCCAESIFMVPALACRNRSLYHQRFITKAR
jgi:hypothetical protein